MLDFNKINCKCLFFSEKLSLRRIKEFEKIVNIKVIRNMLCLSLYLLGVKRSLIALILLMPINTVRTIIKSLKKDGMDALFDRRSKNNRTQSSINKRENKASGYNLKNMEIDYDKMLPLQKKVFVLTLAENNIISKKEAGVLINISTAHVGLLLKKITSNGVDGLIDNRQGQKKDYVFTAEIKSELIFQFIINASEKRKTSSTSIANELAKRKNIKLSPRSIRHYLKKLGLSLVESKIRETFKKN